MQALLSSKSLDPYNVGFVLDEGLASGEWYLIASTNTPKFAPKPLRYQSTSGKNHTPALQWLKGTPRDPTWSQKPPKISLRYDLFPRAYLIKEPVVRPQTFLTNTSLASGHPILKTYAKVSNWWPQACRGPLPNYLGNTPIFISVHFRCSIASYFRIQNLWFAFIECPGDDSGVIPVYYGERAIWQLEVRCPGNPGHGSRFIENNAAGKLLTTVFHIWPAEWCIKEQ